MLLLSGMACQDQSGALGSASEHHQDAHCLRNVVTMAGFVEDETRLNVPFTARQKYMTPTSTCGITPMPRTAVGRLGCRSPLRIAELQTSYSRLIAFIWGPAGHTRFIRMNQEQT